MERFFNGGDILIERDRGASSINGTEHIRSQLLVLFKKYNIKNIFDAGCQDCAWAHLLRSAVGYQGGDINPDLVAAAKFNHVGINVIEFNITTDVPPPVDLLLVRDVTIHFSNKEKKRFLKRFKESNIPWLLITQLAEEKINIDIMRGNTIQTAITNWCLPPWDWPTPTDNVWEFGPGGRSLSLWHRDQIKDLI